MSLFSNLIVLIGLCLEILFFLQNGQLLVGTDCVFYFLHIPHSTKENVEHVVSIQWMLMELNYELLSHVQSFLKGFWLEHLAGMPHRQNWIRKKNMQYMLQSRLRISHYLMFWLLLKSVSYYLVPQTSPFFSHLLSSVQFSLSVVSDSLRPHESQHTRRPCPSPTPGVHSHSCPLSPWCHPAISSSVVPFSSCPQSLPASESFPMSQLFTWGGQSTGVSSLWPLISHFSLSNKSLSEVFLLAEKVTVVTIPEWPNSELVSFYFCLLFSFFFSCLFFFFTLTATCRQQQLKGDNRNGGPSPCCPWESIHTK